MFKFIGLFSLIGFLISVGLLMLMYLLPPIHDFILTHGIAQIVLLCIWPSSIYLAALKGYGSDSGDWFIYTISIVVNTFLYTGVGYLFWLGKHKYRWILYATGILVISFWSWLFIYVY